MEELLRSLRNLELAVPNGEQIVSLIDPDPRVEKQLAQQLAVPARVELDEDNSSALMDAALMSGATEAMLQNYNSALRKESEALTSEREKQAKPMRMKRIPTKALMAAQDAAIRRREEERRASTDAHGRLYMPRQIMDTDHTYCSHADISALTLIEADELQAPHRHTGRYQIVQITKIANVDSLPSCTADQNIWCTRLQSNVTRQLAENFHACLHVHLGYREKTSQSISLIFDGRGTRAGIADV